MAAKRKPFGQNGAKQCTTKARSTGEQCKNPALQGVSTCRVHGGLRWALEKAQKADSRVKPFVTDGASAKRYHASVAFSVDLNACGIEIPQNQRIELEKSHVGARGRKIEALLNRELNR